MDVYYSAEEIKTDVPSAVALGFFDGLHIGHTALIKRCVATARERGLSADVFTFRDNPRNVLAGKFIVPRLLPEKKKFELLSGLGVDRVFDFAFEDGFHTMHPGEFASTLLKDTFKAAAVFCGFNFHFGTDAVGDPKMLYEFGKGLGFDTFVEPPVYVGERLVSSSLIRRCINCGDLEPVGRMLGRDYSLSGTVSQGRQLGHTLGFPTANFLPPADLTLPAFGVYIAETRIDDALHPSIVNVGVSPTVADDGAIRIETHLLDTQAELYGRQIEVVFKHRIREERKFANIEALKRRIDDDVNTAKHWFAMQNRII